MQGREEQRWFLEIQTELLTFNDISEGEIWCFRYFLFFVGLSWKISEASLTQKHRFLPLHISKCTEGSNDQLPMAHAHVSLVQITNNDNKPLCLDFADNHLNSPLLWWSLLSHFTFAPQINGQPKAYWERTTEWRETCIPWKSHRSILVSRQLWQM